MNDYYDYDKPKKRPPKTCFEWLRDVIVPLILGLFGIGALTIIIAPTVIFGDQNNNPTSPTQTPTQVIQPTTVPPIAGITPDTIPTAVTSVCSVNLPFVDDFENGSADCWRLLQGRWEIVQEANGNLAYQGTGPWAIITTGDTSWQNYRLSFDLKPIQLSPQADRGGHFSIMFRMLNLENFYGLNLYYDRNLVTTGLWQNGIWTSLQETTVVLNANIWNTVQIDINNNQITATVDGQTVSNTENSIFAQGFIGFQAMPDTVFLIDNVRVEPA